MKRLLVGLLASLLLSGCGDGPQERGTSQPDRATSESTSTSGELPSEADLAAYFGAVASYDPERLAAVTEIAAPDSVAADYAGYLRAYAESAIAGGDPVPAAEAEAVDGGYRACGGTGEPDDCVVWGNLEGRDGGLVSFTVNDRAVDPELSTLEESPQLDGPGGLLVDPRFAYRSVQSGTLFVLVAVTAGRQRVEIDVPGARYLVNRTELTSVETRGPTAVEPGETETVMFAFVNATGLPLDGDVSFTTVTPGRGTETASFRLS